MKQSQFPGTRSDRNRTLIRYASGILLISCLTCLCICICTGADSISETGVTTPDPVQIFHQTESETTVGSGPVSPEKLESATLVLTRPPESDRIPYTQRMFSSSVEAAIAWWMAPDFMNNTSEFRSYQRASEEKRASYPEEKQIFFTYIQDSLDSAENESVLRTDLILYRGISPYVVGMIMNNSEYREGAFASTTYDPVVSLDVFGPADDQGYHSLLVMERKAGEHALFINENQREYLLPRGSDWQVIKSVEIDNLTIEADFPLYNRTTMSDTFPDVRLIYITPIERK